MVDLVNGLKKTIPLQTRRQSLQSKKFIPRFRSDLVYDKQKLTSILSNKKTQILDARATGRFMGTQPELRPNIPSGHIPGSFNLPFGEILDPHAGTFLSPVQIKERLEQVGISLERPIVATCGSGVTACALAVGLHLLGHPDIPVYDGSWTEWASDSATPKAP
ncbi:MAG: rhodanese-like domain-containing protein [Alphaproteobacteria bacterium]